MAGCNDDIILRKDNVICDKGSGISLKDFVNKIIAQYLAENPSTGGGTSGGSGGGTTTSASITLKSTNQNGGLDQDATTIALPNSAPITFQSDINGMIFKVSVNSIVLATPAAACNTIVASPSLGIITASFNSNELGTGGGVSGASTITISFTKSAPSGAPANQGAFVPNCLADTSSAFSTYTLTFSGTLASGKKFSLTSGQFTEASDTITINASDWTSGNKTVYIDSAIKTTDINAVLTITLSATGTKSDGTSATISSIDRNLSMNQFKVYSGWVLETTDYKTVTTSSLTASGLMTGINLNDYGGSHPSPGPNPVNQYYWYFAMPAAFDLTTASFNNNPTNVMSFKADSDGDGTNFITADTYNPNNTKTYYKSITVNSISYKLYRSNNAFGNDIITDITATKI
jgi:hypothetical protein